MWLKVGGPSIAAAHEGQKVGGPRPARPNSTAAYVSLKAMSPYGGNTTIVRDAWPVRRQTYGYLPSRKTSPPIGWYQIILLGDRGTCVLTTVLAQGCTR